MVQKKLLCSLLLIINIVGICAEDRGFLSNQDSVETILAANDQNIEEALLQAVILNRIDIVQALLYKYPSNVNEAILLAQQLQHNDIEKILLKWNKLKMIWNVAKFGLFVGGIYGVLLFTGLKLMNSLSYDEYEDVDANKKRLEGGLNPRSISLDNAIKIVDSLPEKREFFLKDAAWKEVILASSFRHQNWIAVIMRKDISLDDMSPTQAAMQKLKCKKPIQLQKYCESKKIEIAPLLGYYGSFEHLAQQVSEFEHDMKKKGFITLVHARKADWDFVNDVWNMILAIKNKQDVMSDTFHFRQRDDNCDVAMLEQYRKELVAKGSTARVVSSADQKDKDSELTFCNRTFVSNMNSVGLNGYSPHLYYYQNYSWSHRKTNDASMLYILQLLKKYNLSEYEEDVKRLYESHKCAQEYGQLVCIGIHKNKFDQIVYRSKDFGYKADNNYTFDKKEYVQLPDKASEAMSLFDTKIRDHGNNFFENYEFRDSQQFYCAAVLGMPGEGDETYRVKTITEYGLQHLRNKYLEQRNKLFEKIKKEKEHKAVSTQVLQKINNNFVNQFCFS